MLEGGSEGAKAQRSFPERLLRFDRRWLPDFPLCRRSVARSLWRLVRIQGHKLASTYGAFGLRRQGYAFRSPLTLCRFP